MGARISRPRSHCQDFAISPDGELLAASVKFLGKRNVRILFWNLKTGEQLKNSLLVQNLPQEEQEEDRLPWSPWSWVDKLAFSSCSPIEFIGKYQLQVWCLRTSTPYAIMSSNLPIRQAVFSRNFDCIIIQYDYIIAFCNVDTGKEITAKRIRYNTKNKQILLSQSGFYVVQNYKIITIWNYQKKQKQMGKILSSVPHPRIMKFSRDEKLLILGGDEIGVFDLQTRNQVIKIQPRNSIYLMDTSPDMKYILSYENGYIQIWNLANGHLVYQEPINQKRDIEFKILYSSNQKYIILGREDGIWIKNLQKNKKQYISIKQLESTAYQIQRIDK